jgi:rhamnose utilization protein RhaD (predicted bifunctional aldolase and dehydrogenase)
MTRKKYILRNSVIDYCARIGADPMLVQGAGGNVSWKEGDTLWIKASGTWLADAKEKEIFVSVDLVDLQIQISKGEFSSKPKLKSSSKLRPSIETLLHALMPHRVVVHVHAIEILTHLVRKNCLAELHSLLGSSISWTVVEYQKPGAELAAAVSAALSVKCDVVFLKNHGVIIGGADVFEVDQLLHQIISKLITTPNYVSVNVEKLKPVLTGGMQYTPVDIPAIHSLAINPDLFNRLKEDWALYPDHVVFLGPKPFFYASLELFAEELSKGNVPELLFIKGQGVYCGPDFSFAKKVQLKCYFDILIRQGNNQLSSLTDEKTGDLLNWDAEKYRQELAKR